METLVASVHPFPDRRVLLTTEEMGACDRLTIEGGTPGMTLMERAGLGVADAIRLRWAPRPVTVLAGPGNNGGDGFVVARILAACGWPVTLALLGATERLSGDAAEAFVGWPGEVVPLGPEALEGAGLAVDAIFGAGLSKDVTGIVAETLGVLAARVRDGELINVAVDVPSGLDGNTGEVRGIAAPAHKTVTFHRRKPGHVLMPGRDLCGAVSVIDIGISGPTTQSVSPGIAANHPDLWRHRLAGLKSSDHKYTRGHALIAGGAEMTGAARMAASAAHRVGAGLVSIAASHEARSVYASDAETLIVDDETGEGLARRLGDRRISAVLAGPGLGLAERTGKVLEAILTSQQPAVLDADALSYAANHEIALDARIGPSLVITPHEGEFARLFPDLEGDKVRRARKAADLIKGVVVLKGADTVVAEPSGAAVINENAPPSLAKGGTGDVLAGTVTGLLSQGMPAFEAASAAVWLSGAAANTIPGKLLAGDLPQAIGIVLRELLAARDA